MTTGDTRTAPATDTTPDSPVQENTSDTHVPAEQPIVEASHPESETPPSPVESDPSPAVSPPPVTADAEPTPVVAASAADVITTEEVAAPAVDVPAAVTVDTAPPVAMPGDAPPTIVEQAAAPLISEAQAVAHSESVSEGTAPPPVEIPTDAEIASSTRGHLIDRMKQATGDASSVIDVAMEQATRRGPVEIPDADTLDGDLQAQIETAMEEEPAPAVAPSADAESEAEEPPPTATDGDVKRGTRITGIVQKLHGDNVFVEAGLRATVMVSLRQFPPDKHPNVGDELKLQVDRVDSDGVVIARLPRGRAQVSGNWDALSAGQVVDCMVTGTNKGGLSVTVSSIRGFLPASQIDMGYVGDMEKFVGQKLQVEVMEVNPKKRNLVVSRKSLLAAEREAMQKDFWQTLEVGQQFTGTVKTIKNYGAFVNIGAVDGFLHVGEISWSRINHPNEVLKEGQEVDVKVLKIDPEKMRISLGMKQLSQNPWASAEQKYASGTEVSGRVSRIADFGAFVELEQGVEGLVHISELAWRRVGTVNEVVSVGDVREFKVLESDSNRRRIALSLKALEARPEPVQRDAAPGHEHAPAEEPPPPRRVNENLRGGTGGDAGGGLFGNPDDFERKS